MKRKIIKIDERKCNGCGQCIIGCPEGALQLVDGKAKLASENYCDGLGACIGNCPQGAITIEEREVEKYNEMAVMKNIIKQGDATIRAHLDHLKSHGQEGYFKEAMAVLKKEGMEDIPMHNHQGHHQGGGCPGSRAMDLSQKKTGSTASAATIPSELSQWPIQLHLINPGAAYFKKAELVVAADCVSYAFGNFHQKFLRGKKLIVFCPKLDDSKKIYLEKLTALLKGNNIKSVTVVRMEVPCCYGTQALVEEAVKASGKQVIIKEYVISIEGQIV